MTINRHRKWYVLIAIIVCSGLVYVIAQNREPLSHQQAASQHVNTPPHTQRITDTVLEKSITDWTATRAATYAISVEELASSVNPHELRHANVNATNPIVPASSYKLFVAYATLLAVEHNELSLTTMLRTGSSVKTCLDDMIIQSDNDCARALGFYLGWQQINTKLSDIGMTQTNVFNYNLPDENPVGDKHTTSTDTAVFLHKLQSNSLLSAEHTSYLLGLMEQQVWKERIATGLPPGIKSATKPGWLAHVQSDAGIVYGPHSTYSIVIYSTESSPQPLAELSKLIYDHLQTP